MTTRVVTETNSMPTAHYTKVVHVAVAVIERFSASGVREILISKRAADAHQGGLWEFPGGKVEALETVQVALSRELNEELGLTLDLTREPLYPLIQIQHDYDDKSVLLDVFVVTEFSGTPHGREGQPVRWVPVTELESYDFPVANKSILSACQLPGRLAITPSVNGLSEARAALHHLCKEGISHVILRQPAWTIEQYFTRASLLVSEFESTGLTIMLHGDPADLDDIDAVYIHLPSSAAKRYMTLDNYPGRRFGMSCHDQAELDHARGLGVQFATLSPVAATNSHPGANAMGWARFTQLVSTFNIPVFALGGMSDSDLSQARQNGAQGIAAISAWAAAPPSADNK